MEKFSTLTGVFILSIFSISVISLLHYTSLWIINKTKMKKYKIDMYLDIEFDEVDAMIDNYIQSTFDSYTLLEGLALNPEPINQEGENLINKDIASLVARRMSENMYNRICLFYSKETITDVISEKIGILVMNFKINHNREVENNINLEREERERRLEEQE